MVLLAVWRRMLGLSMFEAWEPCACRWLHPAVFVLTAAFDALDAEARRAGSAHAPSEREVDWRAAEGSAGSGAWGLKRWAQHMLSFHGWR